MRKLLFLPLLFLWGCSQGSISTSISNSSQGCPDQPIGELHPKNVESISIVGTDLPLSRNVSAGKDVGYTFKAKQGQKISYQTQDDICVWVISPDTKVVIGESLPQTGSYTLQVAVPEGAKTFNLQVSLDKIIDSSTSQLSSTSASASLDQATALQIVNNWLNAKSKVFAAPFDRGLVAQYTTGQLYTDITKPNGSIDWLVNNDSYYQYNSANVSSVVSFSNSGEDNSSMPSIKVNVYEDRILHGQKGTDASNSEAVTETFVYYFQKENDIWKIYDYKTSN